MSLLSLAGMFIFGGKKKKKSWAEVFQELAKKHGLPVEIIEALNGAHLSYNGYIEFVRRMDPEENMERVKKPLTSRKPAISGRPVLSGIMSIKDISGERSEIPRI